VFNTDPVGYGSLAFRRDDERELTAPSLDLGPTRPADLSTTRLAHSRGGKSISYSRSDPGGPLQNAQSGPGAWAAACGPIFHSRHHGWKSCTVICLQTAVGVFAQPNPNAPRTAFPFRLTVNRTFSLIFRGLEVAR